MVSGIPTPLKDMKFHCDDDIPNIWKKMFQTTQLGVTHAHVPHIVLVYSHSASDLQYNGHVLPVTNMCSLVASSMGTLGSSQATPLES